MKYAQKKKTRIKAYCLGAGTGMEKELIREGRIRLIEDGWYEVFSQEAENGEGERAKVGDYIKIDGSGYPYPMSAESFFANHEKISEEEYQQIPKPRAIWEYGDPVYKEVAYLLESGQLILDEENEEQYFQAFLAGAKLTSPRDSVLVFYSMETDENGKMDFNFVARKEFDATYDYIIE